MQPNGGLASEEGVGGAAVPVDGAHTGTVGGFPATVLLSDEFDAQEFVSRARRGFPLDELLQDLQRHLLQLRETLVDTINQDYATFVGMASNLKGLDAALARVRGPVNSLREEVGELREAAATAVREMDHKLDERHAITSQRRRLCVLLDAEQGLERMERLLARSGRSQSLRGGELAASDTIGEASHTESERDAQAIGVEILERAAVEGARLRALLWRLDDESATKAELEARLACVQDSLVAQAVAILGVLLAFPGGAAGRADEGEAAPFGGIEREVEGCLRTLMVVERVDAGRELLRQACMRPLVAAAVTVEALEGGAPGTCQGLPAVLARVLRFADAFCLPLVAIAQAAFLPPASDAPLAAPSPLTQRSTILGSCLVAELSTVLLSAGGRRVTHYLDKALASKYRATMHFIEALEGRCGSRADAAAFRASVAVEDLLRKWDLPLRAHLQLRQQEATKALGPLLVGPVALAAEMRARAAQRTAAQAPAHGTAGVTGGEDDGATFIQKRSGASELSAVERPPLPETVAEAGGQLVVVGTVAVWRSMEELLSGDEVLVCQAHRLAQMVALLLARYHEWGSEWCEHLAARLAETEPAPGTQPGAAGVVAPAHCKGEEEMAALAALSRDAAVLAALATEKLPGLLQVAAGAWAAHAEPLIETLLAPPRTSLGTLARTLRETLASALQARCVEPLAAVRAVTSQYRMTNRPPPSKPSLYVRSALQPVRRATGVGGLLAALDAGGRRAVVCEVCDQVAGRYHELVSELLGSVRKLGQTLRKLAKGPAGGGDGISDDKKIYLQLLLDVEALVADVREAMSSVGGPGDGSGGGGTGTSAATAAEERLAELAATLRTAADGAGGGGVARSEPQPELAAGVAAQPPQAE